MAELVKWRWDNTVLREGNRSQITQGSVNRIRTPDFPNTTGSLRDFKQKSDMP